jgi:hypothetical protein
MGGGNNVFAVVAHEGPADFDDMTVEAGCFTIEDWRAEKTALLFFLFSLKAPSKTTPS